MTQTTVRPFLMFEGAAAEAMDFYLSLFPDGKIVSATYYGPGEAGPEGTVKVASFSIAGQTVMCSDSFVKHAFGFTPSFSFFVDCTGEEQLDRLASALAEGGKVLMPKGAYGFSRQFAWISDRFGVSWQINLP
ncbi:VOC family protein [Microvirga thermotolerans]|uniref:VOC family protein n=2 Tax=Microvirga thermotolerans TaxID=2651334 RepID=A0A5P9JZW7_9HYPH|nr:VOC family protein [Microvirga thermotolerans]